MWQCIFSCGERARYTALCATPVAHIFWSLQELESKTTNGEGWNTATKQTEVFISCCCCCQCVKEAHHICAATSFTAIRNNGVLKWTRGIGSVLRITDAGKGSWVWERGERIMNFSKSEKSMWRNLSIALCFSTLHSSLLFHSLILSPSLLCLYLELLRSLWYSGFYMSFPIDICLHLSCPLHAQFFIL